MVVSVSGGQVYISVRGDVVVPTAVTVSDKKAFAIFYSKCILIIPYS